MCLGVPGRVVKIDEEDANLALVDFWGVQREVRLEIVDQPVAPGDYVLNHVGFAIRRIPEEEIKETLELYEVLLEAAERGEGVDMMAEDIRDEIEATGGGSS
jgi:hydrogenase expression/formation protein HypC